MAAVGYNSSKLARSPFAFAFAAADDVLRSKGKKNGVETRLNAIEDVEIKLRGDMLARRPVPHLFEHVRVRASRSQLSSFSRL